MASIKVKRSDYVSVLENDLVVLLDIALHLLYQEQNE